MSNGTKQILIYNETSRQLVAFEVPTADLHTLLLKSTGKKEVASTTMPYSLAGTLSNLKAEADTNPFDGITDLLTPAK